MMLKRLFLAAAVILLTGCQNPFGGGDDHVSIRATGGEIVVRNTGSTPLYVFILVENSGVIVDWAPCSNPDFCTGIAPGEEERTPVTALAGYDRRTADAAAVHTWRLRAIPGGYEVADARTFRVEF